jgi:glycosyltransferase involved in cell wall biosynthesis
MVIGIDGSRSQTQERTGVEQFAFSVIEELKKILPESATVRLYLRGDEPVEGAASLPASWEKRTLWTPKMRFWTSLRLSLEMLLHRPDVLFVPAHVLPWVRGKRTVTVIHDVAFLHNPECYSVFERWYAHCMTRTAVRHADVVVIPSEATRRDIEQAYRDIHARLVVVPEGYDHIQFHTQIEPRLVAGTLAKYQINVPYVFFVGRIEEKKGIVQLVRAFEQYVRAHQDGQHLLVLAGKPGYGYATVRAAIDASPMAVRIRELGFVPSSDLPQLYAGASVLSFATKYEGFGIPVLEARACATPVIVRSGNATEEIAGEATFVTDGTTQDLVEVLEKALSGNADLREAAQRDSEQVQEYTWQRTAQQIAVLLTANI